ncbi:hypothetical protein JVT61DRAFT_6340 [Boletus reticuloceps]|uniref:Uncharacterized protein n=1 Tax=Boletus reticuloceps TaxID=495285 RepID=A0A8I3A6M2_9AGAM|nr:hypothetical protein JVT61DRAFT_6340 [Boletus reticuloceps]
MRGNVSRQLKDFEFYRQRSLPPPTCLNSDSPIGWTPCEFASDASPTSSESITNPYDELGQARGDAGTGQSTPLDETGYFVFSQVGVPVGPSPPPTSPLVITDVLLPPTRATTPHYEVANSDSPPILKRKRSDDPPEVRTTLIV